MVQYHRHAAQNDWKQAIEHYTRVLEVATKMPVQTREVLALRNV